MNTSYAKVKERCTCNETCLHRMTKNVRNSYQAVDSLISNIKSVFTKSFFQNSWTSRIHINEGGNVAKSYDLLQWTFPRNTIYSLQISQPLKKVKINLVIYKSKKIFAFVFGTNSTLRLDWNVVINRNLKKIYRISIFIGNWWALFIDTHGANTNIRSLVISWYKSK